MEKSYTVQKQDLELTVDQIMNSLLKNAGLNLRKQGKPPYDHTVGMMNRCKGLDLVDRVPKELWMEICNNIQDVVTKPSQRKRNAMRQSGV